VKEEDFMRLGDRWSCMQGLDSSSKSTYEVLGFVEDKRMDFLSSLEKNGFGWKLGFGVKRSSKDLAFIGADVVMLLGGEQEKGSIWEFRDRIGVEVFVFGEYVKEGGGVGEGECWGEGGFCWLTEEKSSEKVCFGLSIFGVGLRKGCNGLWKESSIWRRRSLKSRQEW